MSKKFFYTKYALQCFRIISAICFTILLVTEISNLLHNEIFLFPNIQSYDLKKIANNLLNIISCFFFFISIFEPHKFGHLSVVAFSYAFFIIPFEPSNSMGILMFFLGIAILFARGLMHKYTKVKLIILSLILLSLHLTYVRFGFYHFFLYLLDSIGAILVVSIIIFFFRGYYINTLVYEDKKLNIASYSKLTERDCRILKKIQNGKKYSAIAKEENITEGSLKNRLHFVFNTLETGDKQGFLSYYDDYELFFESEDVKLPESQEELQ